MLGPLALAPRLYVYYRGAEAALPTTVAAVRQVQAALIAAHPGLQAELLRRPGLTEGAVTVMETYAGPLTPALESAIHNAIAEATCSGNNALPQPRHVERFQLLV